MKKRIFLLFITFHLSFIYSVTALSETENLEKFLEGLKTFSAGFEQTLVNEYGEEIEKSVGVVYLMTPGKFHWDYFEPYSQFIISDGITLWVYDEDLEQVTIREVADSIESSPAAVLGGDVDIDEHYLVIDMGNKEGVHWQELTPRDIDSQYNSIRLGFRGKELAGMILFDNLGQETRISFLDIKLNLSLDRDLFSFTPPEGVDVIDERISY